MEQRASTIGEYHQRVNQVVEYINEHLGEEIDLGMLADLSAFSPYHFHRIMKAFLGEPLGMFIVRKRVETAARLLRYSTMSVSEIAYKIGYSSPSSLSKVFKQFYGISPNEYRNNKSYSIMKPIEINPKLDVSVEERMEAAKQVIYVRLIGNYSELNYMDAWKRLYAYVAEQKIGNECMEYLCIYHDDPKVTDPERLRTDVCFVVPVPVQPKGEVGVKEIPGGKYLVFRYKGPYSQLGSVYDTIYGHWIPEKGYRIGDNPGYESYVNDPRNTAPEDLITDIYVPVE